jgi:ABC-type nitrate/sulfonate/bicarbonate transport system ATPase subunit/ABC-type transporter Mla maintaining outer membrane lipid asymmetry permease subunit MlaE
VAVILGGSGAGKSTFSRVLFEPHVLERDGFTVETKRLSIDRGSLGLVPQRGALFDHLDVQGNLELAIRYGAPGADGAAAPAAAWLERVGLDGKLAQAPVSSLSGGQAQRVAVARALAGGRRLLFLDEPSVGLDPHRVRMLARLVREQCARGVAAIVVTHDVALAAGCGDRLYVLDPASRRLELLFGDSWPGPLEREGVDESERGRWLLRLEDELIARIARGATPRTDGGKRRLRFRLAAPLARLVRPFSVAGAALASAPGQLLKHPKDFLRIAGRVLKQTVLRPLPFYAIVSALIGYTVLYVISKVGGAGFAPDAGIRLVGGSYIVALAPVLSAMLFVAASGNATNAWLGSMGLTRQTLALQALGVDVRAYLWGPAWVALGVGYLVVAAVFAGGMLLGGYVLTRQLGLPQGWELLSADLFDPRPERARWVVRGLFLVWIYAWGVASDVVAKGGDDKPEADAVTHGMTRSVVACTLWVVAWELLSTVVVFVA